jgi:hypothetical protein
MARSTADVREIVRAVQISSGSRFTVCGDIYDIPPTDDGRDALCASMENVLYQRLYCRPSSTLPVFAPDVRASRLFVEELSWANHGTGTWDPGWTVIAVEPDGTLVVNKGPDDLTLWAAPRQFRPADGAPGVGTVGRLSLGKEWREMLPGFYTILGDADQPAEWAEVPRHLLRVYWHLTKVAAPLWVHQLTLKLNAARVAFRAKVQSSPEAYCRADAGVLYVERDDLSTVMKLVAELYAEVADHLRPATPMFTKQLAPGLAVAEDPGAGKSFGQHRCELVAEGLTRAFRSGTTDFNGVVNSIASRFAEDGLVLSRPWLSAGSRTDYRWPREAAHLGTSTST